MFTGIGDGTVLSTVMIHLSQHVCSRLIFPDEFYGLLNVEIGSHTFCPD